MSQGPHGGEPGPPVVRGRGARHAGGAGHGTLGDGEAARVATGTRVPSDTTAVLAWRSAG